MIGKTFDKRSDYVNKYVGMECVVYTKHFGTEQEHRGKVVGVSTHRTNGTSTGDLVLRSLYGRVFLYQGVEVEFASIALCTIDRIEELQ